MATIRTHTLNVFKSTLGALHHLYYVAHVLSSWFSCALQTRQSRYLFILIVKLLQSTWRIRNVPGLGVGWVEVIENSTRHIFAVSVALGNKHMNMMYCGVISLSSKVVRNVSERSAPSDAQLGEKAKVFFNKLFINSKVCV